MGRRQRAVMRTDIFCVFFWKFILKIMHDTFCCRAGIGEDKCCPMFLDQCVDKAIHLMMHFTMRCLNQIWDWTEYLKIHLLEELDIDNRARPVRTDKELCNL